MELNLHNDLITAKQGLSLNEHKIFLFSLYKCKKDYDGNNIANVELNLLKKFMNIEKRNLEEYCSNLEKEVFVLKKDNFKVKLFESCNYNSSRGILEMKFDVDMITYIY